MASGLFKERFREALDRLRAEEKARGKKLTQKELAERATRAAKGDIAVNEASISRYLRGERSPSLDSLDALAIALNVDPVWLAWGRGEPRPWEREKVKRAPPEKPYRR